jgi:hypothetical protein
MTEIKTASGHAARERIESFAGSQHCCKSDS